MPGLADACRDSDDPAGRAGIRAGIRAAQRARPAGSLEFARARVGAVRGPKAGASSSLRPDSRWDARGSWSTRVRDLLPGSVRRTSISRRWMWVLLTHLHIDHAAELPGIVKATRSVDRTPDSFRCVSVPGGHAAARWTCPRSRQPDASSSCCFGRGRGRFAYLKDFRGAGELYGRGLTAVGRVPTPPEVIYQRGDIVVPRRAGVITMMHPRSSIESTWAAKAPSSAGDIDARGLPALERNRARREPPGVRCRGARFRPASPPILYSLHSPPQAIGEIAARDHIGSLLLSHPVLPRSTRIARR